MVYNTIGDTMSNMFQKIKEIVRGRWEWALIWVVAQLRGKRQYYIPPTVGPGITQPQLSWLFQRSWNTLSTEPMSSVAEKPILIPCWNYFFDLLFIAVVIIIIHNDLPQRILLLGLTVELQCLCSEPCLPVDGRKEEINTSPAQDLPF